MSKRKSKPSLRDSEGSFYIFYLLLFCVQMQVCTCHGVWGGDNLWELLFLPSFHCEFQGLDAGLQTYMQMPLPTEPLCCPPKSFDLPSCIDKRIHTQVLLYNCSFTVHAKLFYQFIRPFFLSLKLRSEFYKSMNCLNH